MSFSSLLASSVGGTPSTTTGLTYSLTELSSAATVGYSGDGNDVDGAYRLLSGGGFDAGRFEEGIAEMDVIGEGGAINRNGLNEHLETFLSSRHSTFINMSLAKSADYATKRATNLTTKARDKSWEEEVR